MSTRKQKYVIMLAMCALVSIALSMSASVSSALSTEANEQRTFTIIVSRNGFNGTANSFSIMVQQGDMVKITFVYGDQDLATDNPHAIMIDGYGIQTANIGRSNPTVTVEFVADESGTFTFYCDIPCLGMSNLSGHLIVTPNQTQRTATSLGLAVSNANAHAGFFLVSATVKDSSGQPLSALPVKFYENTTFGKLWLGTVPTNSQGVATLNYTTSRVGSIQIIAENPGSAEYASITSSVFVTIPSNPVDVEGKIYLGVTQPSQPLGAFYGISSPPNLAMIGVPRLTNIITVALAGVVILGVWSTYAYLGRQILSLRRFGESEKDAIGPLTPRLDIPTPTTETIGTEKTIASNKIFTLFVLAPLLGAVDMVLVNSLGLSIPVTALCLVGLAVLETLAVVVSMTGRVSEQ